MNRVTRLMYIDHKNKFYKITVPDDDDFRIRGIMTLGPSNRDMYAVVEHREEDFSPSNVERTQRVITIRVVCDSEAHDTPEDAKYLGTVWNDRESCHYTFYQMPWPPT